MGTIIANQPMKKNEKVANWPILKKLKKGLQTRSKIIVDNRSQAGRPMDRRVIG